MFHMTATLSSNYFPVLQICSYSKCKLVVQSVSRNEIFVHFSFMYFNLQKSKNIFNYYNDLPNIYLETFTICFLLVSLNIKKKK